jgi:hypothetical protein
MIACSFIFMHRIQQIYREITGQFFDRLVEFGLFFWPQSSTNQRQLIPIVVDNNPIVPRRFICDEAEWPSD